MAAGVGITQADVDGWNEGYPLGYEQTTEGNIYAYAETTGEGYKLGQKPVGEDELVGHCEVVEITPPAAEE